MAVVVTDAAIGSLLHEAKPVPEDYLDRMKLRRTGKQWRGHIDVIGTEGNEFRLMLRRSALDQLDFSVVLAYRLPGSTRLFRLRRHNGRHNHRNRIERDEFFGFHIHMATERYQRLGADEESFAELTDRFSTYEAALQAMFEDASFVLPPTDQLSLFDGG